VDQEGEQVLINWSDQKRFSSGFVRGFPVRDSEHSPRTVRTNGTKGNVFRVCHTNVVQARTGVRGVV
jgi:hypothetical protein